MDSQYVWWYYNYRYSETGKVSFDIEDCYERMQRDGMNINIIKKEIQEKGEYNYEFPIGKYSSGLLIRIPFYGEKLSSQVYILRYPLGAYEHKHQAYKDGVNYVIKNNSAYYWSVKNDFANGKQTKCDDAWYIEVTGKLLENLQPKDWVLLWQARIVQDGWSDKNHVEHFFL